MAGEGGTIYSGNCILLLGILRDTQWLQYITEKMMGIAGDH